MNKTCEEAINSFCKLNNWNPSLFYEIGNFKDVFDLWLSMDLNDVDDVLVPDEYEIGAFYTGDYFAFEIFKEGKAICYVYPDLPQSRKKE